MDLHLVMNAINSCISQDRKIRPAMGPLLFALSDYLHGALSGLPDQSVRRQVELAGLHAGLYACVKGGSFSLRVANYPRSTVNIRRGLIQELAMCLLHHTQLKPGEKWTLQVHFGRADTTSRPLGVLMALSSRSAGAGISRDHLLQALSRTPAAMAGDLVIDPHVPRVRINCVQAAFSFRLRCR